jgi:tetratricopeptide (TPR) repeat protein
MFDKDATTAIDYYNRALKIMDERGVPASEYHRPLNSRAIVHISLGRAVQGSEKTATSASLRQSRSHFQRALDDLQRIDELIEKAGLELKSDELVRLDLFSARAHLGIGDAATGGYRQPEEALRQYLLGLEECSRARATLQVLKPNPDQGISRSSIEGCTQSLKALSSDLESHAEDVRKELGLPAVEAAITRSH